MSLRSVTHGKLPRLPRLESSYRQLNRKLLPVLTWVTSLFLMAAPASAVYTPATPAEILAAVKPVTPVVTPYSNPNQTNPVTAVPAGSPTTNVAAVDSTAKTPEIVITITAAEYVPPAVPIVTESGPGRFPYGQCTYYVATRREVTWIGNAGEWYRNAQASGRSVGRTPAPGAIMVTWESPLGHVAYVDSVNTDGSFVVSEMNNRALGGPGKVDTRIITPGSVPLIGFIY